MNNPLKKEQKCDVCGTKDPSKKYIKFKKTRIKTLDAIRVFDSILVCEDCAILGIGV